MGAYSAVSPPCEVMYHPTLTHHGCVAVWWYGCTCLVKHGKNIKKQTNIRYETMIESVLEDDTTTSNTLDIPGSAQSGSGRRSGRKSDQKGTGGKGKDKGSTSKRGSNKKGGGGAGVPVQDAARWVERAPVVRCVGHAVLRGVSRFLDNEACVDGKALIVDADGRWATD